MTGMSYTPIEIYDSEEEKNQYYGNRISMICVEDPYLEDDEMSTEEDEKEVSDSIPSRKVDWYWLSRIKQLEEYREKWGHCKVPLKDKDLGSFVHRTRKKYNKGTLAEHKINQLDKLGFVWGKRIGPKKMSGGVDDKIEDKTEDKTDDKKISKNSQKWNYRFDQLREYNEKYGHFKIPDQSEYKGLAVWVRNQKYSHKVGKLPQERYFRLSELGLWGTDRSEKWMVNFKKLTAFKELNGGCMVYPDDDHNLAMWVYHQRNYKRRKILPKEREDLLNSIGFSWKDEYIPNSKKMIFQVMCEKLEEYKKRNGDVNVGSKKDVKLYNSLLRYRRMKEQGLLSQEEIEKLEQLGVVWKVGRAKIPWEQRIEHLKDFKKEFGHCNVTYNYSDRSLADWVHNTRKARKMGYLKESRISDLEKLGFQWNRRKWYSEREKMDYETYSECESEYKPGYKSDSECETEYDSSSECESEYDSSSEYESEYKPEYDSDSDYEMEYKSEHKLVSDSESGSETEEYDMCF